MDQDHDDDDDDKHGISNHDGEPNEEAKKIERSTLRGSQVYDVKIVDEVIIQNNTARKCDICGKSFRNGHAMGGHRRSHFLASKNHPQNKEDHQDDTSVAPTEHTTIIDLSKFISPSWKKKDKRGRKCIGKVEAAINLMYLCAKYICDESNNIGLKDVVVHPKSSQVPIPSQKREIGESSSSSSLKFGNKTNGGGGDDFDSDKLGKYKCVTCGQSFSTFQGLGGHRSIHKQKKMDEQKHSEEHHSSSSSRHQPQVDESPLSEVTVTDEASQSTTPKVLDFDLNEPSAMED